MKYFRHQSDDVMIWTNRAHWEAEHGRTRLGIKRLDELVPEFPGNAHIAYDQGLLWSHHVGNGRRAREYFLTASRLADEQNIKGTRWYAASHLAKLADTADESKRWMEEVITFAPKDHPDRGMYRGWLDLLNKGTDYGEFLWLLSTDAARAGESCTAAAISEFSLAACSLRPRDEAARRRNRAECLRSRDRTEEKQINDTAELFLADDRLALLEAIAEIDRALLADPYEAILWNLGAAWNQALGRNGEAIKYADKAIALRPLGYPRPWVNKASAHYAEKRDAEALHCARTALEDAKSAGNEFADDIRTTTAQIDKMSKPRKVPELGNLVPIMRNAVAAANMVAQEQVAKGRGADFLATGIRARIRATGSRSAISYLPMMEQFLSDFSAELAFVSVITLMEVSVPDYMLCMNAAMYLATDLDGVMRRDAARFVVLNLFFGVAISPQHVLKTYREAVLEVCNGAGPPLSGLDAILRAEMLHFHPAMPHLIADQEPLTPQEQARGARFRAEHFTGDPHEFEIDAPQMGGAYTNDPDMGAIERFLDSSAVRLRRWWMLVSGPARRKPPGRR